MTKTSETGNKNTDTAGNQDMTDLVGRLESMEVLIQTYRDSVDAVDGRLSLFLTRLQESLKCHIEGQDRVNIEIQSAIDTLRDSSRELTEKICETQRCVNKVRSVL